MLRIRLTRIIPPLFARFMLSYVPHHSRPQSPSFLGHVVLKQIKPSGSGDENGAAQDSLNLAKSGGIRYSYLAEIPILRGS